MNTLKLYVACFIGCKKNFLLVLFVNLSLSSWHGHVGENVGGGKILISSLQSSFMFMLCFPYQVLFCPYRNRNMLQFSALLYIGHTKKIHKNLQ
jgi:hypothetical protein